ncbi:hypothetical protein RCH06_003216 [Polaromonas sp. CG_9.5]|uniref:hypothetical protein n=1 Tax=Polaromonas sp. CG_9.5 TaxID=3071705 RepID=UPI002E07AD74|nr:hypothetical protein [Polaromonas sp. CG_9.5]
MTTPKNQLKVPLAHSLPALSATIFIVKSLRAAAFPRCAGDAHFFLGVSSQ